MELGYNIKKLSAGAHISNPAPERPRQDDYKHREVKDRDSKCNKAYSCLVTCWPRMQKALGSTWERRGGDCVD